MEILRSKNYWVTEKHDFAFASWSIILPCPQNQNRVTDLLNLYKCISKLGEELDIFMVAEKNCFLLRKNYNYANYIERIFLNSGRLESFGEVSNTIFDVYSKIAYYNKNNILKEEFIKDMGSLMVETRDIDIENTPSRFVRKTSPIDIMGGCIADASDCSNGDDIHIFIGLYSDIWFPWLLGALEKENDSIAVNHPVLGKAYDNRELAYHHTPRLNKFLFEVFELVSNYGGEWEKGDDTSFYSQMFNETGIYLD